MRVGTKSLLFGGHQFIIHPIILFFCYWKLYGFPFDPRLWLCFIVHDWGYFGCKDMDGEDGKYHPIFGASIVRIFCGKIWRILCVTHSRKFVEILNKVSNVHNISKIGVADKLAIVYTPLWMYCRKELDEYIFNEFSDNIPRDLPDGWSLMSFPAIWKSIVNEKALQFVKDNKDTAYEPRHYQ